jgi:hypothetical protein
MNMGSVATISRFTSRPRNQPSTTNTAGSATTDGLGEHGERERDHRTPIGRKATMLVALIEPEQDRRHRQQERQRALLFRNLRHGLHVHRVHGRHHRRHECAGNV